MKKINRIIIKHLIDENPDLSYLGEFSNEEGEFAIKHDLSDNRTYNYFNAENVENMKQAMQNYERMMGVFLKPGMSLLLFLSFYHTKC